MRSTSWTLCAFAILVVLAIPGPASAQRYNFTVLDPPNADPASGETSPIGINKSGVIVGFYQDSNNVRHGFVSQPPYSTFTVIDAPGAGTGFDQGTEAYGINATGVRLFIENNGPEFSEEVGGRVLFLPISAPTGVSFRTAQ